jgi:hypothetical protein
VLSLELAAGESLSLSFRRIAFVALALQRNFNGADGDYASTNTCMKKTDSLGAKGDDQELCPPAFSSCENANINCVVRQGRVDGTGRTTLHLSVYQEIRGGVLEVRSRHLRSQCIDNLQDRQKANRVASEKNCKSPSSTQRRCLVRHGLKQAKWD